MAPLGGVRHLEGDKEVDILKIDTLFFYFKSFVGLIFRLFEPTHV